LQTSLDDNNIQMYLIAIEVVKNWFEKLFMTVYDSFPSMVKSLVMHTTDTNTRVRKQSIEIIN